MGKRINIVLGEKYNRLKILKETEPIIYNGKKYRRVDCICDCGNIVTGGLSEIMRGIVLSCGCARKTHGMTKTKVYNAWLRMRQRCYYKKHNSWGSYGGRGITIDKNWELFKNFYDDMGEPPTEKHTLDRIDVNNGYSKENCRWATIIEQANNTRLNVKILFNNETHTLAEWARILNIKDGTLRNRYWRKWPINKLLTK
jgi:hypothetical protein